MKSMIFSIAVWAEVTTACVGDKITKSICSAFGILTGCSVSYLYILGDFALIYLSSGFSSTQLLANDTPHAPILELRNWVFFILFI
jgi:hypothetical protein